jgi:hypothetical protein
VYFTLLATIAIPFVLTFLTINTSMISPDFATNPSPLGYTTSLLIFVVPILVFFIWLLLHPKYKVERNAALLCVAGVFLLGSLLDVGFGYHFFRFPNITSFLGIMIPAFDWSTFSFVPGYLPIEEFLFYLFGGTYMLCSYLWGVLYWFRRYNHPNHKAEVQTLDSLIKFDFRLLILGVVLIAVGILVKKTGPYPQGFPGYYTFLVCMAFLPIVFCFRVVSYLINWRAFAFMSFNLLLVSIVYEASLGVPYGWWRYNPDQMLGFFITAWSGLPAEAVFLWIAAGFGTVLLFEFVRAVLLSDRSVKTTIFGEKDLKVRPLHRLAALYNDARLPAYLDDGIGFPVPRGPYQNTKGDMANFFVKVDPKKVQALCDKYLNSVVRKDIKYYTFLDRIIVTFAKMQGYVNKDDGTKIGQLPEGDMVFWIPTLAVKIWFGIPFPSHIATFPYRLYVDSAYGLSSGREALGLFKNYAEFQGGNDIQNPQVTLNVLGFKTENPDKLGGMLPLLTIERSQPSNSSDSGQNKEVLTFASPEECLQQAWKALRGPGNAHVVKGLLEKLLEFVVDLVQPEIKSVSLKQFRDIADPTKACLQQIIEVESTVNDFEAGGFLQGGYNFVFHPVATDSLAQDLGIELENGVQKDVPGFWVRSQFTMGSGVVIR